MSVSSTVARVQVIITALPQTIPVFEFNVGADLLVLDGGNSNQGRDPADTLTIGGDYTATGGGYNSANALQPGAIVVVGTGPHTVIVGDVLTILRGISPLQATSFVSTGPRTPLLTEQDDDFLTTQVQQIEDLQNRCLTFEKNEGATPVLVRSLREGKVLGFDANGNVEYFDPASAVFTSGQGIELSNISSLKAVSVTNLATGQQASVSGYYYSADGGGGLFVYNSVSAVADNGGTVIAPNAGSGRWIRAYIAPLNVRFFGAKGDGVTSDTNAIQAALDIGVETYFPVGTYACVGLTASTSEQVLRGDGGFSSTLVRNNDGVILTVAAYGIKLRGLTFIGESSPPVFTGNNVVIGAFNDVDLIDCNSYQTLGRGVLSLGNHTMIRGGLYQTADSSGTGYDIEFGTSGTATLYQKIQNIRTSQATGGIKTTDTGSTVVMGSQFGKLSIVKGTGPAGVNGGMYAANRILGAISIGVSSADFAGNQIGPVAVTLATGTSGSHIDTSNDFQSGATVVNSGNVNNLIMREVSSGSVNTIRIGDDNTYTDMTFAGGLAGAGATIAFPGLILDNAVNQVVKAANGSNGFVIFMSAANNLQMSNAIADKAVQWFQAGASGLFQWLVNSVEKLRVSAQGVFLGGTTAFDTQGSGTPESAVTAPVGSTYRRTDGGANTSFYVKESGSGNTGWAAK